MSRSWPSPSSSSSRRRCPRNSRTTSRACCSTSSPSWRPSIRRPASCRSRRARTGSPIPFHPGAIRYYREQQAWTQLSTGSQSRVTSRPGVRPRRVRALLGRRLRRAAVVSHQLSAAGPGHHVPERRPRPSAASRSRGDGGPSRRTRPTIAIDAVLIVLSLVALVWPIVDLDAFVHRAATPTTTDLVLGIVTIGAGARSDATNIRVGAARSPRSCFSPTATTVRCSIASAWL